jgi:hypothetical protein
MSEEIYSSIFDVATRTPLGPESKVLISKDATHYIVIKVSDKVDKTESMVIDKITEGRIKVDVVLEDDNEFIILFFIRQIKTSMINKIEVTNGYYKKFREEFEPLTNASDIFDIINKNDDTNTTSTLAKIIKINNDTQESLDLKNANQNAIDAMNALTKDIEEKLDLSQDTDENKGPPRENDILDNSKFLNRITTLINTKLTYISTEYEKYVRAYVYKKDIEDSIKQECDNFIEIVDKIHISIEKSSKYSDEFKEANNITISKIFEKHLPDKELLVHINKIIFIHIFFNI